MAHSNGVQGWIGPIILDKLQFLFNYYWYITVAYSFVVVIIISCGIHHWLTQESKLKTKKARQRS